MATIGLTKLREDFVETVNRVQYQRERVVLERHGKPVAALVSLADLRLLEELEDRLDLEEAERVLSDPNTKWVPWEEVKAKSDALP